MVHPGCCRRHGSEVKIDLGLFGHGYYYLPKDPVLILNAWSLPAPTSESISFMTNPCNLHFGEAKHLWVLTSLPHQEADYLLGNGDLDGLIFAATSKQSHDKEVTKGHQMVYINEVACYMNFKTFTEVIHMHPDKLKLAMKKFATVWGGLDLTKNYRLIPDLGVRQRGSSFVSPFQFLQGLGGSTLCCTFEKYIWALRSWKHEASTSRLFIKYPGKQKMLDEAGKHGEYQLFKQSYVPEWDKVGQWRCLMVNLALSISLFTLDLPLANCNSLSWTTACGRMDGVWRNLACREFAPPSLSIALTPSFRLSKSNLDQCNFMIREGRTWAEISKAQAEI
ncbi:hypothetical protein F4604DRAFT_1687984 [Suillus subluteus]|nr:hypothetical protein F4604DRAFT_1687984 [Suillus subluteus]